MSRYIDAEWLKAEFPHDEDWNYPVNTNSYVVRMIYDAPTIDLDDYVPKDFHDKTCEAMAKRHQEEIADILERADVDRPQGEWIEQEDDYYHYWECSECGMGVGLDDIRNYCPNCGARMKGSDDE